MKRKKKNEIIKKKKLTEIDLPIFYFLNEEE